jgi:hypothetical protein
MSEAEKMDVKVDAATELVEEAYTMKRFEGLGYAFVCKVCGTVFIGLDDAKRHLTLYHRIVTRKRLEEALYEAIKGKGEAKPKDRVHKVIEEYLATKS